MAKPKKINPLERHLRNLLGFARQLDSIPGFASDTLKNRMAEAETALAGPKRIVNEKLKRA